MEWNAVHGSLMLHLVECGWSMQLFHSSSFQKLAYAFVGTSATTRLSMARITILSTALDRGTNEEEDSARESRLDEIELM
jgi:hypothetical protein